MLKVLGKPLPMPKIPPLSELGTGPEAARKIEEWSDAVEAVKTVNDALFERDLKRMKRCALLNGFIGRPVTEHFAWCPHKAWDSYWKDQGWPGLPSL